MDDIDVFMSAHVIGSGIRWSQKLSFELEQSNYGIVCFSPGNINAPWLLFEAGAISKLGDSAVCGLLLSSLKQTDISGPLSQFQNRRFTEGDFYQLLSDINNKLKAPKNKDNLKLLFAAFWPKIDSEYQLLLDKNKSGVAPQRERTERELLEELLFRVRSLEYESSNKILIEDLNLESVLQLPINSATLSAYSQLKFPNLPVSESWQEQLLSDLNPANYQYIRDIDAVLQKSFAAIEQYKVAKPSLFQYSTDYLTKALGFVDSEFREMHPFGWRTIEAFKKYKDLIEKQS